MTANVNRSVSSDRLGHVLLVIGGSAPSPRCLNFVAPSDQVICADSGVDHARVLGLTPDHVIGDMDSISDSSRAWAASLDARFVVADRDKDQTDTELALAAIANMRPRSLTVLWGGGDRIDHVLGVMAAVAAPILSPLDRIDLWVANDLIHVLHGPRTIDLDAPVGTTVSLVPLVGSVEGVTSTDLQWNLNDETLNSNRARGVSNVIVGSARVDVRSGVLAVIIPARAFVDTTTADQAHHHEEQP